jgi:hypothetical protein
MKSGGRAYSVGMRMLSTGGKLELVLDDLESEDGQASSWRKWAFFTSMVLDQQRVLCHELTDAEYARIGQAVMARLVALRALEGAKE